MEKVPSELFECPVCLEIPTKGEIYQCKNGHIVCESCSKNTVHCPQCRVAFEPDKLRSRMMESLVSAMEVGCKFEKQGCGVRMSRKDLQAHLENSCEFNPAFNLCKVLGLRSCGFISRRPDEIYRHFVEQHEKSSTPQDGSCVWVLSRSLKYMKTSKENRVTFSPIGVTIKSTPLKLLLVFYTNIKKNDYSVICLYLGDDADEIRGSCDVKIEIHAPQKKFGLVWSGQPSHYTKAEEVMANPPFKMSIPYILKLLGDADEELDCKVIFS